MDYLFENLGDERFQEFCNALLSKEYPDIQVFPVGQPDGGRDSIIHIRNYKLKQSSFFVFQIKFVRNPHEKDIHKWLTDVVKNEAPKIKNLIPKGALKYFLLTNVKGTAHLENGSIDKVNKILGDFIDIPATCWWRDDLCARIEKDPIFKWSYPQILSGQDILNSTLFNHINENKSKRESIVRAYLADQYEIDNEVKFKQINLQNNLLELFTDVPIIIKDYNRKDVALKESLLSLEYKGIHFGSKRDIYLEEEYSTAANFILHPFVQTIIPKMLLEGGPGQGKSTISQYVCQVHRARLLMKTEDLKVLPENLRLSPIRLPIKIDLRHIALWIEKKNPYENVLGSEYFNLIWRKSLESFLLGHIVYHSQIEDITSSDVISIMKESSVLIVFDGFDEIANIQIREEVVELINKGINRLSENSKSMQVIVTSRPAAFSETIGFSTDIYPHFKLTDITNETINEYVYKWIKASQLNEREAKEIKVLVEEKLKLPHLKDLAKSPMQLAILISLLRTRGESLPNKRTALYDSYIELFFNRESEKNLIIRNNRDLILEIHEFLAWVLHSEAELNNTNGTIQIDDLKSKLYDYLQKEGHSTELADDLFDVVKERVCALVSRIQGTFEFEVQPLREYFCAKFLYNTAPYSPPGNIKPGTKPERFDAIAKNYYWQNVVRFFAGCFDKGELPMLVDQLKILQEDEFLKYTNYPALLSSQILSDWVFNQSPRMLDEIVKTLTKKIIEGQIITHDEYTSSSIIILSQECGGKEISRVSLEKLKDFPPKDFVFELCDIIKNNPYGVFEFWVNEAKKFKGEKLTKWFQYANYLDIINDIPNDTLIKIIKCVDDLSQIDERIQIAINAGCFEIIEHDIQLKEYTLKAILEKRIFFGEGNLRKYTLGALYFTLSIFDPYVRNRIIESYGVHRREIFINDANSILYEFEEDSNIDFVLTEKDQIDNKILSFLKEVKPLLERETYEWESNLELWDLFVESLRKIFGENSTSILISTIAAGIKDQKKIEEDFSNLQDNSKSLCKRVRYSRLKSGNIKYWSDKLDSENTPIHTLLIFLTWATPRTIVLLLPKVEIILRKISIQDYKEINRLLSYIDPREKSLSLYKELTSKEDVSDELKFILRKRVKTDRFEYLINDINFENDRLWKYSSQCLRILVNKYLHNADNKTLLDKIKTLYLNVDQKFSYPQIRNIRNARIPYELAVVIISSPLDYPRVLVDIAEKSCQNFANKKNTPVGKTAKSEKWFE